MVLRRQARGNLTRYLWFPPNLPYMPRMKANQLSLGVRAASSDRIHDSPREFEKRSGRRLVAESERGLFRRRREGLFDWGRCHAGKTSNKARHITKKLMMIMRATFALQVSVEILDKTGFALRVYFLLRGSVEAADVRNFHPKSIAVQAVT